MTVPLPGRRPRAPSSFALLVGRAIGYGAACLGLLGGIVGLVVGLLAYPPTAWFAVFELGIPSAAAGAAIGAIVGSLAAALRHASHDDPQTSVGVGTREPPSCPPTDP